MQPSGSSSAGSNFAPGSLDESIGRPMNFAAVAIHSGTRLCASDSRAAIDHLRAADCAGVGDDLPASGRHAIAGAIDM